MDWLRCNRCYRASFNASRSFSITHCGHVYCTPCINQMAKKCPQCGAVEFKLIPLTKPPKAEMTINYFGPLEDFMGLGSGMTQFRENQMMIAVKGARLMEPKYTTLKIENSKLMNKNKELEVQCKKLHDEGSKIRRALESQRQIARDIRSKVNANRSNFPQHNQNQQKRRIQGSSPDRCASNVSMVSCFPAKYGGVPHALEKTPTIGNKKIPTKNMPKYPYNPSIAFSHVSYNSCGTPSDSSSSPAVVNSGGRVEGFLVPNVQRVPKSAATVKRTTPTGVRINVPKIDEELFKYRKRE